MKTAGLPLCQVDSWQLLSVYKGPGSPLMDSQLRRFAFATGDRDGCLRPPADSTTAASRTVAQALFPAATYGRQQEDPCRGCNNRQR